MVAVFLLREWITQNARPGVFDDAEAPPEGDVIPPAAPADALPAPAPAPEPVPPPALQPIPIPNPAFPEDLRAPPFPNFLGQNGEPDNIRHGERRKRGLEVDPPGVNLATSKGKEVAVPSHKAGSSMRPLPSESRLPLEPERARFTFQLPSPSASPPNSGIPAPDSPPSTSDDLGEPLTPLDASSSTLGPTRRPTLTASDLPYLPSPPNGTTSNPPTSPSLTTYRPPEEFEAVPSSYFHNEAPLQDKSLDSDDTSPEDMDYYFRELSPVPSSTATAQGTAQVEQHAEEDDSDSPPAQPFSEAEDIEDEEDAGVPENEDDDPPPDPAAIPIGGALLGQQDQQQPARVDADPMDQEEMDAAMDDDMDGALEGTFRHESGCCRGCQLTIH